MDELKGKTILIGKEPGQGRLLVAVSDCGKTAAIGVAGSVPNSVSRCRPKEGVAHAKISIDGNGNMTVTNMKSQNVTYVNGSEIASKHISISGSLELGKDRYAVNLPKVIEAAKKLVTAGGPQKEVPAQRFNISYLEDVWNDVLAKRKAIQAKQKKINLIRSGCGIFTMCAMPCILFFGPIGYVLTGVGIIGNVYSFVGLKNDDTTDVIEHLNDEFQEKYICPNPGCGKFLGSMSYKLLKRQYSMHCPYCKCEFIEK